MSSDPPKQEKPEPQRGKVGPDSGNSPSPPILRAELQIPQSAIDAYNLSDQKTQSRENWRFGVEVLGFLAIVAYATVAALQWGEMRRANALASSANEQTRINIADSERPWIGPLDRHISLEVGKKPFATLVFGNLGKTPAFDCKAYHTSFPMTGTPPVDTDKFMKGIPKEPLIKTQFPESQLLIFPQGKFAGIAEFSKDVLTDEDKQRIMSGRVTLVFQSEITYRDNYDRLHHTRLCEYFVADQNAFTNCPAGNYAD